MIRISDRNNLLEAFRSLDRDEVILPDKLQFPLALKEYLSWVEPSGARAYLVFPEKVSGSLLGLVFRRNSPVADARARMCEWCHCVRSADEVGLLSVASSPRQRVGLNLCRDLSCKDKIFSPPHTYDMRETIAREQKLVRILEKMNNFARATIL